MVCDIVDVLSNQDADPRTLNSIAKIDDVNLRRANFPTLGRRILLTAEFEPLMRCEVY